MKEYGLECETLYDWECVKESQNQQAHLEYVIQCETGYDSLYDSEYD